MQIKDALQVAKANIIKIWSGIKGCNEEVIRACGGLPAGPPPHEGWDISHTPRKSSRAAAGSLDHQVYGSRSCWKELEKQSSQREIGNPYAWSEAPNKRGSWNQGTPPSRPCFWNKCAEVDRRRSALGEAMRDPQLRHERRAIERRTDWH